MQLVKVLVLSLQGVEWPVFSPWLGTSTCLRSDKKKKKKKEEWGHWAFFLIFNLEMNLLVPHFRITFVEGF